MHTELHVPDLERAGVAVLGHVDGLLPGYPRNGGWMLLQCFQGHHRSLTTYVRDDGATYKRLGAQGAVSVGERAAEPHRPGFLVCRAANLRVDACKDTPRRCLRRQPHTLARADEREIMGR